MLPVQVVILAAGKSSRLYPLTLTRPKSLLEFGSEPLLIRTVRQLHAAGFHAIRIVVGHLQEQIREALAAIEPQIEFVENPHYDSDTNSLSLHLGLQNITKPTLLIEADVAFADSCWPLIQTICLRGGHSVWFTHGLFQPHQVGGIIKSDSDGKIIDMRIVSHFETQYATYSKNLGAVYLGTSEINRFKTILSNAVSTSTTFYYMDHWINNLSALPCEELNLAPHPAGSFNTAHELALCRQLVLAPAME